MPRHVLFLRLAYQAGMCLLALVAVTLTAIDLTTEAAEWEVTADRTIYWIFVLDYVIRFSISRSKWLFVKEHPWDLLAIIPFDALFRLFRFASLGEILRLARYLDLFSYAMRFNLVVLRHGYHGRLRGYLSGHHFRQIPGCIPDAHGHWIRGNAHQHHHFLLSESPRRRSAAVPGGGN